MARPARVAEPELLDEKHLAAGPRERARSRSAHDSRPHDDDLGLDRHRRVTLTARRSRRLAPPGVEAIDLARRPCELPPVLARPLPHGVVRADDRRVPALLA